MRVKYLIPFLVLVLIFGFAGCTIPKTTAPETTTETTTPIEENEITTTIIESSSIKYDLTEAQRQQAFYELCVLQDSISDGDPQRNEKMEEAYLIIAKKYDITKDEMVQIVVEGIEKNWPFPPLK